MFKDKNYKKNLSFINEKTNQPEFEVNYSFFTWVEQLLYARVEC